MKFSSFSNRRKFRRLLRTRAHKWKISLPEQDFHSSQMTSLSPTGISFKVAAWTNLVQGQKLSLNLSLEDTKTYACEGKVIWIKPGQQDQMNEIGVRFSKVPSGLFEKVAQLCKEQEAFEKEHTKLAVKRPSKIFRPWYEEQRTASLSFKQAMLIVLFFCLIGIASHLARKKSELEETRLSSTSSEHFSPPVAQEQPSKFTGKRKKPSQNF